MSHRTNNDWSICPNSIHDTKRYLIPTTLTMKAAGKREESKACFDSPEREQARPKVKSMCDHFVEDEHYCYFDDMYSPEYTMLLIYKAILKHDIDAESQALLEDGHKEIIKSECYVGYGYPSYLYRNDR